MSNKLREERIKAISRLLGHIPTQVLSDEEEEKLLIELVNRREDES